MTNVDYFSMIDEHERHYNLFNNVFLATRAINTNKRDHNLKTELSVLAEQGHTCVEDFYCVTSASIIQFPQRALNKKGRI